MEQKVPEKVRHSTNRIGGVSIAWVTLYGALCGVTSLVPIFPYIGGGGYVPLTTPLSAIAPLLLGPVGGVAAALVGGVIGMFIAPAAYPLQVVDIFLNAGLPAIFVALMLKNARWWKVTVPLFIVLGILGWLVPFYVPGAAAGFGKVPEPLYFIMAAIYWLPSTIIAATPLGTRLMPEWVVSSNRVRRYGGVFLTVLAALFVWWLPWTRPYWYLFNFSAELGVATHLAYSWWVPTLSAITAVITIPIVEALERSGLPKIEGAIW
ncbi:MAG: hypothetical protein PHS96_01125 [Anaerolineales bacterium]|nr:hypothetical protein [Anaerolineales bacterium]